MVQSRAAPLLRLGPVVYVYGEESMLKAGGMGVSLFLFGCSDSVLTPSDFCTVMEYNLEF